MTFIPTGICRFIARPLVSGLLLASIVGSTACLGGDTATEAEPSPTTPANPATATIAATQGALTGISAGDPAIAAPTLNDDYSETYLAQRQTLDELIAFWGARAEADSIDFVSLNQVGDAYLRRARLTGDTADFARAREAFERSVASNSSSNYGGVAGLAHVLVYTHHFTEAVDYARAAIEIKPWEPYAVGVLGDALLALGDYDDAYDAYIETAEGSTTLASLSRLAFILELRGDRGAAEEHWLRALELSTNQPEDQAWALTQTGTFYLYGGDVQAAARRFDEALALIPDDVHALAGLARAMVQNGQLADALPLYERVIERQPLPRYAAELGELYEALGRPDDAREQYALVGAIEQIYEANGIATDLEVARFLVDHGPDAGAALTAARAAYEARPSLESADVLGWALRRTGDLDEARAFSDESLRLGTQRPAMLFHAGVIRLEQGDTAAAGPLLRQVDDTAPLFSLAHVEELRAALGEVDSTVGVRP